MSFNGWHLVHSGMFLFYFEKGLPIEKEYFTYGLSTKEEKFNLLLLHPFLENKYGINSKKSKLNANNKKVYHTIEIDLSKIDVKNDIGYKELVSDRNCLYRQHFIRDLTVFAISMFLLLCFYVVF
jgi:hypothetical protein